MLASRVEEWAHPKGKSRAGWKYNQARGLHQIWPQIGHATHSSRLGGSMDRSDSPLPWPLQRSTLQQEYSVYNVRRDTVRSPKDGKSHDFDIVEAPDGVAVLALTPDGELVMVQQYRHGVRGVTLEFPGGLLDDDRPEEAAVRELREETGYEADSVELLGTLDLNPSWETTRVHVLAARDSVCSAPKDEDEGEETRVRRVSREDARRFVLDGHIRSAVAVAALHILETWERARGPVDGQRKASG
jgi:ADP-ribose pyrophosphatase